MSKQLFTFLFLWLLVSITSYAIPQANRDNLITGVSLPSSINVLANDTTDSDNALTLSSFDPTSSEGGTVANHGNGVLSYTPPNDFSGTDSFSYGLSDGSGTEDTATVSIQVKPVSQYSGTLAQDTIWTADKVYLISGDVTVPSGVTLTISAGTVIKFQKNSDDTNGGDDKARSELIIDKGALIAEGTPSEPIVLTSHTDKPAAGDWGGIRHTGKGQLTLRYVTLEYTTGNDPNILVVPSTDSFGNVIQGHSSITPVTISNDGNAGLNISDVAITGTHAAEFSQKGTCTGVTLISMDTCAVEVVFSPVTTGYKSAVLVISSNDPDTPVLNLPLTGWGVNDTPPVPLIPTIQAVPEGGNWNSPATWVENRVPKEDDIVEINGTVRLNTSSTVAGLVVNSGSILAENGSNKTLTVNGDVLNNGTIQNYNNYSSSYYPFEMSVSGNITNNGVWRNYQTKLTKGHARTIGGINAIEGSVYLDADVAVTNNPIFAGYVGFEGHTVTLASSSQSLTLLAEVGSVTIAGNGSLVLAGADQNISGTITAPKVTLRGSGKKRITGTTIINAPLIVETHSILEGYYDNKNYSLTVKGDVLNNGTIRNYSDS
ncbi:MAG: choice-of-anchor D domain-containing protein, partial [Candidatus Parabeggiatoa sp.]|nr:choice-of-anchor D domain-containing protein [Candidatus Parabeggiatoa sp.]